MWSIYINIDIEYLVSLKILNEQRRKSNLSNFIQWDFVICEINTPSGILI